MLLPERSVKSNSRRASQRSSNLARGGRQGCCSFWQRQPRPPQPAPGPDGAARSGARTSCVLEQLRAEVRL